MSAVFRKPPALCPGDCVAVLSPSWGGPSVFPRLYEAGLAALQRLFQVRVKEMPTARADAAFLRANPRARAADVNNAFADPEIKALFASIGGDDSVRILPFLDREIIANNPKVFLGFSDTTALHVFINQLGLVTFNGPSIMAGFAQSRFLPPPFAEHMQKTLTGELGRHRLEPFGAFCDGYLEWSDEGADGAIPPLKADPAGYQFLQGGTAKGPLFGGCMEVFEFLKGTDFWPRREFWDGKILFLETSEEKPSARQVHRWLRNYGSQGLFDRVAGVLFGRPRSYSEEEKQEFLKVVDHVIAREFGRPDLPVVANIDFGHTDPQRIMPLGIEFEIDCPGRALFVLESPVVRSAPKI